MFWFKFNSALGLLNQKAKNLRSDLELGRLTLKREFLSIAAGFETEGNTKRLTEIVQDIVGPAGIKRLPDVLAALDHRLGPTEDVTSDPLSRGKALEARAGAVLLLDPKPSQRGIEVWVGVRLRRAAREIARAMLYGPIEDGNIPSSERFRKGVRTDLISEWLDVHSSHKASTRAIEAVCRRFPDVFVRTGPTSWGLVGAEAQNVESEPSAMADVVDAVRNLLEVQPIVSQSDVTKKLSPKWSDAWIHRTIGLGLKNGYLINRYSESQMPPGRGRYALNIGADLPESERSRKRKPKPQQHGQLIRLVITVLKDEPKGISEEHLLRRVRKIMPDASADSVGVYLNRGLKDILEISPDRLYRLKDQSIRELTEDPQGTLDKYTETSLQNLTSDGLIPFRSI